MGKTTREKHREDRTGRTFEWYRVLCFPWPESPASDLQLTRAASPLHPPNTVLSPPSAAVIIKKTCIKSHPFSHYRWPRSEKERTSRCGGFHGQESAGRTRSTHRIHEPKENTSFCREAVSSMSRTSMSVWTSYFFITSGSRYSDRGIRAAKSDEAHIGKRTDDMYQLS